MNVDFSLLVLRAESQRVAMQKVEQKQENPSKKRKVKVQCVINTDRKTYDKDVK